MNTKGKYLAFVLTEESRAQLLSLSPPAHERVIAHHVTIEFNITDFGLKLLEAGTSSVKAIAYGGNHKVDCAMVMVNGSVKRPDGSWYHVTISCGPQGKPVDSNEFLKACHRKEETLDWSKYRASLALHGKLELLNK